VGIFVEIDDEFIEEELSGPKQDGPLRFFDKEMRCSNRGCSSPTYLKIQGVPRCSMHALRELNEMLVEAGFHGIS
jgi:hypothetical protein